MRKRFLLVPLSIAAVLGIGGCVTVPTGPSVMALPGSQKPFDAFRADEADCRQYAYEAIGGIGGEQAAANSAASSAVAGTLLGAAAGAVIGSATGQAGPGAAIGAGTGLLFGSLAGSNTAGASYRYTQRRYDNAYLQCMYGKGNQVPMRGQSRGAYGGPPGPLSGPAPYYSTPYPYSVPRY
jgi:Glycine-zipper domain